MALSPLVRFGTSTWTYEGWKGHIYKQHYPKGRFKQDCLAEYARYAYEGEPLFRTVGFDFTFYGPPTAKQLAHYASLVPDGFEACAKVWEEVTIPEFPPGLLIAARPGRIPGFWMRTIFSSKCCRPSPRPLTPIPDRLSSSSSARAWTRQRFCRSSMPS